MVEGTWERVSEEGGVSTHRMRVADGWLYRVTTSNPAGVALAFAPSASGSASGAGTGGAATPGDTASTEGEQATEDTPRLDD